MNQTPCEPSNVFLVEDSCHVDCMLTEVCYYSKYSVLTCWECKQSQGFWEDRHFFLVIISSAGLHIPDTNDIHIFLEDARNVWNFRIENMNNI